MRSITIHALVSFCLIFGFISDGMPKGMRKNKATGDPADSVVTLFLHNGTSYFLFDEFDLVHGRQPAVRGSNGPIRGRRSWRG